MLKITHPCVLCPTALGGPLSVVDSWVVDIALSNIKCPVHRIPWSFFDGEIFIYLERRHILIVPLPSFSWPLEKLDTSSLVLKIYYFRFQFPPVAFSPTWRPWKIISLVKNFHWISLNIKLTFTWFIADLVVTLHCLYLCYSSRNRRVMHGSWPTIL